MFKKATALALACVLALSLVGCSSGSSSSSSATEAAATAAATEAETEAAAETEAEAEAETEAAAEAAGVAIREAPEGFPNKDITLVNPYEPGGTSDIPSRIFADWISKNIDKYMMNVTDITGSSGAVGAQQVMGTAPDGYTLLVAPAGYAMQYAKGSCDFTYEDFDPVCLFVTSYMALVVNTSSGITSYEELIERAKENDGELKFGVTIGGLPMFCVLAMEKQEGVNFNVVDIGGTTLKAPELLSNRIDVMIDSLAGIDSYVESGDFQVLGVYADNRFEDYPDVPTFRELGYDTNVMDQVFGVWAPKGTPRDVIEYEASLFGAAAADPDVQQQLTDLTYTATFIDTDDYNEYLKNMYADFIEFAADLDE